jgi:hypothetical protein
MPMYNEADGGDDQDRQAASIPMKIWLELIKLAGRQIDPETAQVEWRYAQTLDPYNVYGDLPEELQQVGREFFARCPGSDIWVNFRDLPKPTQDELWRKYRHSLAFPAGLAAMREKLIERGSKAANHSDDTGGMKDAQIKPRHS